MLGIFFCCLVDVVMDDGSQCLARAGAKKSLLSWFFQHWTWPRWRHLKVPPTKGEAFKVSEKYKSLCAKNLVARIAQAGNDVAHFVQVAVDGGRPAAHIGMGLLQRGHAFRRGHQHESANVGAAFAF